MRTNATVAGLGLLFLTLVVGCGRADPGVEVVVRKVHAQGYGVLVIADRVSDGGRVLIFPVPGAWSGTEQLPLEGERWAVSESRFVRKID